MTDDSCVSEQSDTACASPATELHDSSMTDDTGLASAVRSVGAVAMAPKTLTPAKTLPASLVSTPPDLDDRRHSLDGLGSPMKLVPPVEPQHIHAIVVADSPSVILDDTVQPDVENTEDQ